MTCDIDDCDGGVITCWSPGGPCAKPDDPDCELCGLCRACIADTGPDA
jgi:hypothetical protein